MSKSLIILLFAFLFYQSNLSAQENYSIQFNGGFIYPINSSDGLSGSVQLNYNYDSTIIYYLSAGYSAWDKFNVIYLLESTQTQTETRFRTYDADDHSLMSIYAGAKIKFNTNKIFTSFVVFEAGYSYFSYSSFGNFNSLNPETGMVLGYYSDMSTKKNLHENLIGIGAGLELLRPINENFGLRFAFKINGHLNSSRYSLFSNFGIYKSFLFGVDFKV